ncbi:MAG: DUF1801 domain-containing protein [Candidatus Hatepunaea meridiana]|nr:DUF1801 domain-containing protein [Candidatus Hatepunaea meridiana]
MKANTKIDNFIEDTLLVNEDKGNTIINFREMVLIIAPNAKEKIKYGGLVFMINNILICGIFIRKNHISIEFSRGVEMQDTDSFLEGSGKYRRHLKRFQQEDINNKKVEYYVKQCFRL